MGKTEGQKSFVACGGVVDKKTAAMGVNFLRERVLVGVGWESRSDEAKVGFPDSVHRSGDARSRERRVDSGLRRL